MVIGAPATGEFSYNGYEFEGASHADAQVEFIYDDADRTIVAHKIRLTITAIVQDDDGTDGAVLNLRRRLGEAGKPLTFVNRGFGADIELRLGGKQDVINGPKPRVLAWHSLGDDNAAEIVWRCDVTVAVCPKGKADRWRGIMGLNWSADYRIDRFGDTTRTLDGYIQIANQASGTAADTADRYREHFSAPPIAGFTREQVWGFGFDRTRLRFVITDTQIPSPNPYPPGIVEIDARHRVSWRRNPANRMANSIIARIVPEARLSGAQAWFVFLTLAIQRMRWAQRNRGRTLFIEALDAEESMFTREHNFAVSYRFMSSIKDFVGDAGLWRAIGTGWQTWAASLSNSTFSNRGNANLRDIAANDVVVSLCESPGLGAVPNNLRSFEEFLTPIPPRGRDEQDVYRSPGLKNHTPSPGESFLEMKSLLIPERESPVARQSIMQGYESLNPSWLIQPRADLQGPPPVFEMGSPAGRTDDIMQVGGSARYTVSLAGWARRAAYPVPRPTLRFFGGVPATETYYWQPQWVEANYFGVAVYQSMWYAEYLVPRAPATAIFPDNAPQGIFGMDALQPSPGVNL